MLRIFGTTLILFIAVTALSCSFGTRSVAVADVCRESNDTPVRVAGYFRLPQVSDWVANGDGDAGEYKLIFAERLTGGGSFVKTTISGTGSNEPNRIAALPASYTYDDLRINTSSGKTVSPDERVFVTGRISKDPTLCVLRVEKVEIP